MGAKEDGGEKRQQSSRHRKRERSREETASSGPGCLGVFTATLFHEGTCRLFIQ